MGGTMPRAEATPTAQCRSSPFQAYITSLIPGLRPRNIRRVGGLCVPPWNQGFYGPKCPRCKRLFAATEPELGLAPIPLHG